MIRGREWMALLAGLLLEVPLAAQEMEQRIYRVQVDGKPAGEITLQLQTQDDGSQFANIRTVQQVKLLAGTWRFGYHGIETWEDGRLVKFEAALDDDGKKRRITAAPLARKLRVTVNDQRDDVSTAVWTTTFWKLPANVQRTQSIALLDVRTGKERTAKLEYVGDDKITAAEQSLTAGHYRLTGAIKAELWYDGLDRLLRAEVTEDGRRRNIELSRVARNKAKANGKRQ